MTKIKLPSDHVVNSTDTNEYAEGMRDENLAEAYLYDVGNIPVDDYIPEGVDEMQEGERPIYDEEGYVEYEKLPE